MKKTLLITFVFLLTLFLSGFALAGDNAAQFCKDGGTELIANALADALYAAHGVQVDLDISEGACVSTVATHSNRNGVNTNALATDFCKQVVTDRNMVRGCVEHVEPALAGIFHPAE